MCKGAQLTGWEKRLLLDMQSRKPTVRLRPLADAQRAIVNRLLFVEKRTDRFG